MNITLTTGRIINSRDIAFDAATYHFFYAGGDITDLIYRRDKLALVPGFDVERENLRIYQEGNAGAPATGSVSVWGNLWEQLITDPLAAPLEYADTSLGTVGRSLTGKVLLAGAVVGVLYYFRDDLKKLLP